VDWNDPSDEGQRTRKLLTSASPRTKALVGENKALVNKLLQQRAPRPPPPPRLRPSPPAQAPTLEPLEQPDPEPMSFDQTLHVGKSSHPYRKSGRALTVASSRAEPSHLGLGKRAKHSK